MIRRFVPHFTQPSEGPAKPVDVPALVAPLKDALNKVKTKLDSHDGDAAFWKKMKSADLYRDTRSYLARKFNAQSYSNAWLKMYEIGKMFKIADFLAAQWGLPATTAQAKATQHEESKQAPLVFCNAEMPGGFIMAINHLMYRRESVKWDWVASSLYKPTDANPEPLGDTYQVFKKNPKNWLTPEMLDGDVTNPKVIDYFQKYFAKRPCSLYTSDLGLDVSEDYNNQEAIHARANLGQILCGLVSLGDGGIMITKQYTMFEPFTISLVIETATCFKEFFIVKPLTSRPTNSEIYLVGVGFNKKIAAAAVEHMQGALGPPPFDVKLPLFDLAKVDEKCMEEFMAIVKDLTTAQVASLTAVLDGPDIPEKISRERSFAAAQAYARKYGVVPMIDSAKIPSTYAR
jgi:hypothetical protein